MTDTYGHDEAMRDLSALNDVLSRSRNRERVRELSAYIHRLEAADTRLLAAAEAALAVLDTAEQERDAHDEPNRMVMDGDSYVAALSKLRAAIEQHKEGRS